MGLVGYGGVVDQGTWEDLQGREEAICDGLFGEGPCRLSDDQVELHHMSFPRPA